MTWRRRRRPTCGEFPEHDRRTRDEAMELHRLIVTESVVAASLRGRPAGAAGSPWPSPCEAASASAAGSPHSPPRPTERGKGKQCTSSDTRNRDAGEVDVVHCDLCPIEHPEPRLSKRRRRHHTSEDIRAERTQRTLVEHAPVRVEELDSIGMRTVSSDRAEQHSAQQAISDRKDHAGIGLFLLGTRPQEPTRTHYVDLSTSHLPRSRTLPEWADQRAQRRPPTEDPSRHQVGSSLRCSQDLVLRRSPHRSAGNNQLRPTRQI
jgi:hypothetical protein